jgi:hypothetical protein
MACEDLVVGCFLDDRAPLAVPELNREGMLSTWSAVISRACLGKMRSSRFRIAYSKEGSRGKAF